MDDRRDAIRQVRTSLPVNAAAAATTEQMSIPVGHRKQQYRP